MAKPVKPETLTETERLLLMAAAIHDLGPATDLGRANSARVVNQVLRWRGLSAEEITTGGRTRRAARSMRTFTTL